MDELYTPWHIALLLAVAVMVLAVHFLPVIIAGKRHVRNFWWIAAITLFFSWTLIGWVVALVWALRDAPDYPDYPRAYYMPPPPQY